MFKKTAARVSTSYTSGVRISRGIKPRGWKSRVRESGFSDFYDPVALFEADTARAAAGKTTDPEVDVHSVDVIRPGRARGMQAARGRT